MVKASCLGVDDRQLPRQYEMRLFLKFLLLA